MKTKFEKIGAGIFVGLIVILWSLILSFKSPEPPPQSLNKITSTSSLNVYRLSVDGNQYIIVQTNGGVAITRHIK